MSDLEIRDLTVDAEFHKEGFICMTIYDSSEWSVSCQSLTVNQVKNLMSHLQRALDEHGERNE